MRIAVVDDERPARGELVYLIKMVCPEAKIYEADNSTAFIDLLDEVEFDACFLDIDLGGANGTTLASLVKERQSDSEIIFATAYRDFAVKAFELGAIDYLLKPFDLERVKKCIIRIQEIKGAREKAMPESVMGKIMVNSGTGFLVLNADDIIYIETEKRSCRIHTKDNSYLENESMGFYEHRLKSNGFFRIHKSYLVNLNKVEEMIPGYNNGYALKMKYFRKESLPIGRTQLKEFRQLFGK